MNAVTRAVVLPILSLLASPALSAAPATPLNTACGGGEARARSATLVASTPAGTAATASRDGASEGVVRTLTSGTSACASTAETAAPDRAGTAPEELAEATPQRATSLPPLIVDHVGVGQVADLAVMSPDESVAYVTGHQEQSIVVIDLRTVTVRARLPLPDKAWGLAISPDGRRLFVASTPFPAPLTDRCSGMSLPGPSASSLFILDAGSGALLKTLPLPAQAFTLLLSPDGTRLAAITRIGVELIDLASETSVASIFAPPGMTQIDDGVFAAGGSKLFAISSGQGAVVFDLAANTARSLQAPAGYRFLGIGIGAVASRDLVFTTVTKSETDALVVIDGASEATHVVPPSPDAFGGVLAVDRLSRVFLPGAAEVLDASTLHVVGHLPSFYFGAGVAAALSPDESILWTRPVSAGVDSLTQFAQPVQYDLLAIDTRTLRTLAHISISRGFLGCTRPTPLVLGASGQVLVAPNPALLTVSVVKACQPASRSKACG